MDRSRFSDIRKDILLAAAGTFFMALSTNFFYSPAELIPGGFTGLAIIIRHVFRITFGWDLPIWAGNILLNIPLILFSIKLRGFGFISRTLYASLMFSGWMLILPEIALAGDDLFIVSVIGGTLMGIGLGIVFLGKATTGGSDTLSALVQRLLPHLSVAQIYPAVDGIIILLSVWIFGLRVSMYAVITVVLSGIISDRVISGARNASLAYIVSDSYQEIGSTVMREMNRGATLLNAKGMYTGSEKPVLMIAVATRESVRLKEIVYSVDPLAFMIITDANEVRGEGFLKFTREEL